MKSTVILGGSSGIGLAVVQNLSHGNTKITNISRTSCAVANVLNVSVDVANTKKLCAAIKAIDRIDTLIYCAGTSEAAPLEHTKSEDIKYLFDVNIVGAVECIKAAMPKLQKSADPRIILLSSSGGVAPIAFDGVYSAAKAGLYALAVAVRLECPKVKCTAVAVPATQTQFSFKRKIYTDCAEYDKTLKAASDALIKMEQTGYSPDYVAKQIIEIMETDNPPPKVTIGTKNKLMLFAYNLLPWQIKLFALRKIYDIK